MATSAVPMADSKDLMVMSDKDITIAPHREFFRFWKTFVEAGRLPGRSDLDPAEWRRILPQIMLVDVLRDAPDTGKANGSRAADAPETGLRFRFRLMGDYHVEVAGRNMTGEYLDQALELDGDTVVARYSDVVRGRQPHLWRNNYLNFQRRTLEYERVAFPFATDGWTVDLIVALLTPAFLDNQG